MSHSVVSEEAARGGEQPICAKWCTPSSILDQAVVSSERCRKISRQSARCPQTRPNLRRTFAASPGSPECAVDAGNVEACDVGAQMALAILVEASVSLKPCEAALDDPASGQEDEPSGFSRALDYLQWGLPGQPKRSAAFLQYHVWRFIEPGYFNRRACGEVHGNRPSGMERSQPELLYPDLHHDGCVRRRAKSRRASQMPGRLVFGQSRHPDAPQRRTALRKFPTYHPTGVILAVVEKACGSFSFR